MLHCLFNNFFFLDSKGPEKNIVKALLTAFIRKGEEWHSSLDSVRCIYTKHKDEVKTNQKELIFPQKPHQKPLCMCEKNLPEYH